MECISYRLFRLNSDFFFSKHSPQWLRKVDGELGALSGNTLQHFYSHSERVKNDSYRSWGKFDSSWRPIKIDDFQDQIHLVSNTGFVQTLSALIGAL